MNRRRKNRNQKQGARPNSRFGLFVGGAILVFAGVLHLDEFRSRGQDASTPTLTKNQVTSSKPSQAEYALYRAPEFAKTHSLEQETVLVWGGDHAFAQGLCQNLQSNIRSIDYAGHAECQKCHAENYQAWSNHAHRWMNVEADEVSIKGDFSGGATSRISYRGGVGTFFSQDGQYRMQLTRDGVARTFQVNRTLGSRVHQYYVGKLISGPEGDDHPLRQKDHVLPFGFELTMNEWVPIVHATGHTGPDTDRDDPFVTPSRLPYDLSCSVCHTTPPIGNLMLAMYKRFAAYTPRKLHFEASNYIDEMYPGQVELDLEPGEKMSDDIKRHINELTDQAESLLVQENLVDLGITCEACHLGAKAHAENEKIAPLFFPAGEHIYASGSTEAEVWGRNDANKNFVCARCHSGNRPRYAAGMATWNSTEYTDAMQGHCYHPTKAKSHGMDFLTCVSCHDPHQSIGRRWQKTAAEDQASCVRCHDEYANEAALVAHTHHPVGAGSECMNCHMPRINEGLGDMVRTHAIFSPTNVAMLESNQPNACNMCHVEESIDWTITHLKTWYGLEGYSEQLISRNYVDRTEPATLGWLRSPHSSTRLVGSDVLLKAKAHWALPQLVSMLNDPHMENRQFTVQRMRDFLDLDPARFGYKHYMTAQERRASISRIRDTYVTAADETE